ncbi:MAG: type II toxin-antitoxin system RelE/ParE family toxin [Faecalimonas sp.]|nr:type II toxin-antitoxin system RelE/ParE family toxin [Faecalimonas sp.]
MQEPKVLLTWEAIYDIAEITDYIESAFGKTRADHFQDDMKSQLESLKIIAGAFGKTFIFYRNLMIYKKPFPPSIIFYIVDKLKNQIHILRVLREERNWKPLLSNTQEYTYPKNIS